MAYYNPEQVRKMLRSPGSGGIRNWARSVGLSVAGSTQSQHEAAAQFFEVALGLKGDGELFGEDRDFAQAELARHQRALGLAANPPASKLPKHGQAV